MIRAVSLALAFFQWSVSRIDLYRQEDQMLFVIHSIKQQRWARLKENATEVVSSVVRRHPPVEKIEAPEWLPLHYQRSFKGTF